MDRNKVEVVARVLSLILLFLISSSCQQKHLALNPSPLPYEIKEQIDKDFIIVRDLELQSYLQSLVFRLIANYGSQVSVDIARDGRAFARSFPGGLVLISTSLIKTCNSESELAFVLAHELGHVILGHLSLAVQGTELEELRERELAADSFGAKSIVRSGFSLNGAFTSIQRMTGIWDFYDAKGESGYPSAAERLGSLQNQMMSQTCLTSGTCLMGGIGNSREFMKFKLRLLQVTGS